MTAYWMYASPTEEQRCASKLAALDAIDRSSRAEVFMSWAQCEAERIEFGANHKTEKYCKENHRIVLDAARNNINAANARRNDPDMVKCSHKTPSIDEFLNAAE